MKNKTDLSHYGDTLLTILHFGYRFGTTYMTVGELSKRLKLSRYLTQKLLKQLVENGHVNRSFRDTKKYAISQESMLIVRDNPQVLKNGESHLFLIHVGE